MIKEKHYIQKSIDEFSERQDNQDDPHHNLDDKVPSYLLYAESPSWVGILLIGLSVISAISEFVLIKALCSVHSPLTFWQFVMNALLILVMTGLEIFLIIEGVRKIRSKKSKQKINPY